MGKSDWICPRSKRGIYRKPQQGRNRLAFVFEPLIGWNSSQGQRVWSARGKDLAVSHLNRRPFIGWRLCRAKLGKRYDLHNTSLLDSGSDLPDLPLSSSRSQFNKTQHAKKNQFPLPTAVSMFFNRTSALIWQIFARVQFFHFRPNLTFAVFSLPSLPGLLKLFRPYYVGRERALPGQRSSGSRVRCGSGDAAGEDRWGGACASVKA